jgi:hypothetical protein
MIKAHYKNNLNDYLLFANHYFKTIKLPQITAYSMFFVLAGMLILISGINNKLLPYYIFGGVLFMSALLLPFISRLMLFSRIKKNIAKSPNFHKTEDFYEFDDEKLHLIIRRGKSEEDYNYAYEKLYRAYETKTYFYIYLNGSSALIIPKNNFDMGTSAELHKLFSLKLQKKFRYSV